MFVGIRAERLQFNEITLWTGDGRTLGAYQPFGDVRIELLHPDGAVSDYARELDREQGLERVHYALGGVRYEREYFGSSRRR